MELDQASPSQTTWLRRQRQWVRNLFPNLRDAAIRWSEDDAGSLAASVAYYLALSLFPMLLLLITGLGLFLEFTKFGQDAQSLLLEQISEHGSEVIREQVSQVLQQFKKQSVVSGPVGTLMAILAAIAVFAQLDRGFDKIWRIPAKKGLSLQKTIINVLLHRCFAFLMLLSLGGMVVGLFICQMVIGQLKTQLFEKLNTWFGASELGLGYFYSAFQFVFVVAMNALLFGMVYKWLPKKDVGWQEALRGGLLASVVWELGRMVLGVFLIGMKYTVAYGVIGSFIALLLWCYYGMSIVFFGAEYVQVLQQRKLGKPAIDLPPISIEQKRVDEPDTAAESRSEPALALFATSSDGEPLKEIHRHRPRLRRPS
jgi:membrane protein